MIYGSWVYVSKMKLIGIEMEDLPIPIWIVRSILPIGYLLLVLRLGQVLWALITGRSDRLHLGNEADDALRLKSGDAP